MHNTKHKPLASLRYARTTKTLQEEAGAYIKLKNVDPSTTHPSSTCTDTKKEKSQLNEPNTVDTYLRYDTVIRIKSNVNEGETYLVLFVDVEQCPESAQSR